MQNKEFPEWQNALLKRAVGGPRDSGRWPDL